MKETTEINLFIHGTRIYLVQNKTRYFLICYIINIRKNSLCQVKETLTQSSLSCMLSNIEINIRILLKLNVPRILVLVLVHLPNGKVNFVIMMVTFPFVAQVTINLMMQKKWPALNVRFAMLRMLLMY